MKTIQAQVANHFIARAQAQGMKGKARDKAAVEFMCGAASMAVAEHGQDSKQWSALSAMAFLVSVRGYSELERFAKGDTEVVGTTRVVQVQA